ncbi:MAG: ParB/RepB/Spo0J family partition protein [Candidatus Sumerlaeaceae bacterium]|nr:ParB/RepB/Spo0J family partition protein [Candidatus Sumerlaeaceae bacterium]
MPRRTYSMSNARVLKIQSGTKPQPQSNTHGPRPDGHDLALIDVAAIEPDPLQPRKDVGDLAELEASIRIHGLIQPVIVSPAGPATYRIIAGERRFRAACAAGLARIPAIVRTQDEHHRLEVQIIENLHREDLNPVELAEAYQRLLDEHSYNRTQLARMLGKSRTTVTETLRILDLPPDVIEACRASGTLTRSALLELAKNQTPDPNITPDPASPPTTLGTSTTVRQLRQSRGSTHQAATRPRDAHTMEIKTPRGHVTVTSAYRALTRNEAHAILDEAITQLENED